MNQPIGQSEQMQVNEKPSIGRNLAAAIVFPLLLYVAQYIAVWGASILFSVMGSMKGMAGEELRVYGNMMLNTHTNAIMIAADLLIIVILVCWFGFRKVNIPKALEMKKVKFSRILLAFAAGIALAFVLSYLMSFAYMLFPSAMEEYSEHMSTDSNPITYVLSGIVLAPIVEELLFRALAVKHLDRVLPRALSIFLVAGLFGLMHLNIVQGLYAGTLGALLGCLFFAYGSVWVPMALHFGFNLAGSIGMLDLSGLSEQQLLVFSLFFMLFQLLAIFGGGVALVVLFVQRTNPVFFKRFRGKKAAKTPAHPIESAPSGVIYNGGQTDDRPKR